MKTQDELLEHYWSVIVPMARNHGVKPWECVKLDGRIMICHPKFEYKPDIYTFAITILEGKPVFVGDKLYANNCTKPLTIKGKSEQSGYLSVGECTNYAISILSWNPPTPKRTFMLNCVELPCPIQNSIGCRLDFLGVDYHFETVQDRNKVADAISNILNQSRDKE